LSDTIVAKVFEHARNIPHNTAIISGSTTVSYEQLLEKIQSAAATLIEMGVRQGDRVVLAASNSPAFIYAYFASHLIGGIAVPIDPQTPKSRLGYIIYQVEPKGVFTVRDYEHEIVEVHRINELDCQGPRAGQFYVPSPDGVADIMFTTGTTGNPKGVILTHENIFSAATNINQFIKNSDEDVEVVTLPLSHSFGLGRLRCNILAGGALVLTGGMKLPGQILRSIEKWNATGFTFVPAGLTVLFRLTGDELRNYSEQLRYIEIGSAPMTMDNKKRLMRLLPKTRICMHYGLTEASRSTFIEFHESKDKLHSIGKPSPNVEVKVSDEDRPELPSNQSGRILVKGKMVMKGYWRDEELTKRVFHDGWLYTGDIGYRDADGYIYLAGREGDIINVGGLKVSPAEVEEALTMHEKIENCACIGIPDPGGITGEAVKAFLVAKNPSTLNPEREELVQFLNDKLEPYKIPVDFEWVDSLPQTASGKIQRNSLKRKTSK
jgi:long-chain acyl-CoA synthetase